MSDQIENCILEAMSRGNNEVPERLQTLHGRPRQVHLICNKSDVSFWAAIPRERRTALGREQSVY
jgi:hypothetical protein